MKKNKRKAATIWSDLFRIRIQSLQFFGFTSGGCKQISARGQGEEEKEEEEEEEK